MVDPVLAKRWKMQRGQTGCGSWAGSGVPQSRHFRSLAIGSECCVTLYRNAARSLSRKISGSTPQRREQVRNLAVHVAWVAHRVDVFLAKYRRITLANALDAGAHAALCHSPLRRQPGVFAGLRLLENETAQWLEAITFASLGEFLAQLRHHRIQHRPRPAPAVDKFTGGFLGGFRPQV